MRSRKLLVAAVTAFATAVVTLVTAAPAQAALPKYGTVYPSPSNYGHATFNANSDVTAVCDDRADGRGIYAYVQVLSSDMIWVNWYRLHDTGGSDGICVVVTARDGDGYDLPEYAEVKLWVCIGPEWFGNDTCYWRRFINQNY